MAVEQFPTHSRDSVVAMARRLLDEAESGRVKSFVALVIRVDLSYETIHSQIADRFQFIGLLETAKSQIIDAKSGAQKQGK